MKQIELNGSLLHKLRGENSFSLFPDSTLMTLIRLIYADKACKISEDLLNLRHLRSITGARLVVA